MASTPTKPAAAVNRSFEPSTLPSWPMERSRFGSWPAIEEPAARDTGESRPSGSDALQALLAFSAMHQQVRRRRAMASRSEGFETISPSNEFETAEQFVLDEMLQLVAERAVTITGADGLGIALAENNEIVLRASAGVIKPDVGARIQRDSAFSGACFRKAQLIRCDDTETDERVNLQACRRLGARSMVAVPLCGRRRVIGLLEAFSADPFGFNDSDVVSLELLAELVVAALKPEDEDRFAESAQVAEAKLAVPEIPAPAPAPIEKVSGSAVAIPAAASLIDNQPETLSQPASSPVDLSPATVVEETAIKEAVLDKALLEERVVSQTELSSVAPQIEENLPLDTVPAAESSSHHPGVLLILVLVVLSALLAGGLWWKLKNAQLAQVVVQPEPKMERPAAAAKSQPSSSQASSSSQGSSSPATSSDGAKSDGAKIDGAKQESSSTTDKSAAEGAGAAPQEAPKLARVTGIRHWSSTDSSTIVLDLEDQVQYEAHRLPNPDRIYFDLHDTALAADLEGKVIDVGDALLGRVRVAQPSAGLTRVVLETKGNSTYSVSLEPNPYRLVVQLRKIGASSTSVNLFPEAERRKMAIIVPPPTSDDLQMRARFPKMRIVVDAGHGGWDLGTVGRKGLLEKDLVLEIAQRLGKLLESRLGAEVILTRNDDNYIPLDERAGMANQSQADLFVSVHANYSDLASARGVETYYTNFFATPNAKDLESRDASRKNAASATLSPADLHDKIEQSRRLAVSVQRSLYGTLSAQNPGLRDRGVKEASYVVLTETTMPGILAEVSFVSSPADEQKLQNDGYREQIAEALYKGIAHYAANSHGVKMASR